MFPYISYLSPEVTLQIVRKYDAVSYTRLRRSCKIMDDLCEKQRQYIGIRPFDHSVLRFSDEDHVSIHDYQYPQNIKVFATDNVDIERTITSMTRKNVPALKAAISGFRFDKVEMFAYNWDEVYFPDDFDMKQAFKNAVSYFQQATVDVYPVKLFTKEIDPQIIQRVAACWKLEGLEMEDYHFDASVLNIDVVQNVPELTFETDEEHLELLKAAKNKRKLEIYARYASATEVLKDLAKIATEWVNGQRSIDFINILCDGDGFNWRTKSQIFKGRSLTYLGSFNNILTPKFNILWDEHFDFWLCQLKDGEWGMVKLFVEEAEQVEVTLETIGSYEEAVEEAALLCESVFDQMPPVDLSFLREKLSKTERTKMGSIITQFVADVAVFYKRKQMRTVINIIHELITEPWNWPRWILELNPKEQELMEKRLGDFHKAIDCCILRLASMTDGCCGKSQLDVEVKVRPLKGYWLPKESVIISKTLDAFNKNGALILSNQDLDYKKTKDDQSELKCIWKADSVVNSSQQTTPPRSSTPLKRKTKNYMNLVKARKDDSWRNRLSRESVNEYKEKIKVLNEEKKTSSKSFTCHRCKCMVRRRKVRKEKKSETNEKGQKNKKKKGKQEEVKEDFLEIKKEEPAVFPSSPSNKDFPKILSASDGFQKPSGGVTIEPNVSINRCSDKEYHRILWELKWWAVLAIFWIIIVIYRISASTE